MRNLGAYFSVVSRYEDAARMLEAALPPLRKELGPASPHLAPHVINLSNVYCQLGRYQDGVKLLEGTIAEIPEKDRVEYLNFDFILINLAECYRGVDDLPGARRALTQREKYLRSRHPADSLELSMGLLLLGSDLNHYDLFTEAERVLREAVAIGQSKEPNGYRVIVAKVALGVALAGQKRYTDAEPLLAAGCSQLQTRWQQLGSITKEIADKAQRRLALLYAQTGKSEEAVAICRRKKELLEKSKRTDPESLYNAACWCAITAAVLKSGPRADASQAASAEADQAMVLLRQAVAGGFKDLSQMKHDHDLDALRGREDFKNLLAELRPKR